jgi:hypothetical protein
LKAEVETAFNNASDKEDPAWLIQWVIDHKLVCDIIFNFLFQVPPDAESDKNIKEIKILLKRNWSFTYYIFIKEIERNILNLDSIFFLIILRIY